MWRILFTVHMLDLNSACLRQPNSNYAVFFDCKWEHPISFIINMLSNKIHSPRCSYNKRWFIPEPSLELFHNPGIPGLTLALVNGLHCKLFEHRYYTMNNLSISYLDNQVDLAEASLYFLGAPICRSLLSRFKEYLGSLGCTFCEMFLKDSFCWSLIRFRKGLRTRR